MGVIKDEAISGVLPDSEGFVVHYPGYPSSITRATETLGGTEGILKARRSKSNSLELHFRPEDPHAHPAFAELGPYCSFLLKISKKKTSSTFIDSESPSKSSTAKVANLETVACNSKTASVGNTSNEAQSDETEVHTNLFADIVARVPEAYYFKGMVDYQHVLAVHAEVSRRKKRQWADVEPKFVLQIPKKFKWEEYVQQGSTQWEGLMALSKLFDEHPIWSSRSLTERLLDDNLKLDIICLKGFFLKLHTTFQLDLSVDFGLGRDMILGKTLNHEYTRALIFDCLLRYEILLMPIQALRNGGTYVRFELSPGNVKLHCSFANLRMITFNKRLRSLLNKQLAHTLRKRVAVRFLSVYPKLGGEYLLKSANKRFEKSKRAYALRKESRPDEGQHVNGGSSTEEPSRDTPTGVTGPELNFANDNDEPDEDEENYGDGEIEEEEEEEFEEYASLHLEGAGDDFSLQSSYPIGENISKNYLQELFGGFPSSGVAGSNIQDGDISDYQILGDISDDNDNYSDGDN